MREKNLWKIMAIMNIICDILSNFIYNPSLKIIQLELNESFEIPWR